MRLLITTILGCLITFTSANAQNCTAAPSCAELGYTQAEDKCKGKEGASKCPFGDLWSCDTKSHSHITCDSLGYKKETSDCPGKYIRCPFSASKVMCLPEAHSVGDLKYSWSIKDHDGWLLCNGRDFSDVEYPDLYKVLGSKKLPSYNTYFLKGAASTSTSTFKTAQAASLPNIMGSIYLVSDNEGATTGGVDGKLFTGTGTGNVYDHGETGGKGYFMKVTFDASKYSSIYKNSTTTVTPPNYSANIFIYAGKYQGFSCSAGQFLLNDNTCSSASNSNEDKILGVVYEANKTTSNGNSNCFEVKYAVGSEDLIEHGEFSNMCTGTVSAADAGTLEAIFGKTSSSDYRYANLNTSRKYYACGDNYQYTCMTSGSGPVPFYKYKYHTCDSGGCSEEMICGKVISTTVSGGTTDSIGTGNGSGSGSGSDCHCTKVNGWCESMNVNANCVCEEQADGSCKGYLKAVVSGGSPSFEEPSSSTVTYEYEQTEYNPDAEDTCTHGYYVSIYTKTICGIKNN